MSKTTSQPAPAVAADGEVPSARTANSRTFEGATSSGSQGPHLTGVGYTTRVYAAPVNYRDSSGTWQKIDTMLRPVTGGWSDANATAAEATVPATLDKGVTVGDTSATGGGVRFSLDSAAAVAPTVTGSAATYPSALPGVDVTTTTLSGGFRQVFTIDGPSRQNSFTTHVALPVGAVLTATAAGGAQITQGGTLLGTIPAPTVTDAAGATSPGAVSLSVAGSDLVETISPAWMHDPARSWPLSLDPDYYYNVGGSSATIQSANPNTNISGTGTSVCVGWSNTGSSSPERGLLSFPDIGTMIPRDAELLQTAIGGHVTSVTAGGTFAAHVLTRAFTTSQVTWNKADTLTSWTTAGGDFNSEGDNPQTVSAVSPSGSFYRWFLDPKFIQSWLDGGTQAGFVITSTNEAVSSQICMAGATDATSPPFLELMWQNRTGLRSDQQYFDRNISDHESLHINLGNGNLTVVSKDLSDNAPGIPFAVYRTWNLSQADQPWQNGYGWYQAPAESGSYDQGGNGVFSQADGTTFKDSALVGGTPWRPWHLQHYDYTGSTPFGTDTAAPGLHETSGFDSSGNRTITDNESGTVQTLTHASEWGVATVTDRNGNVETINHGGMFGPVTDDYPTTIVDTAGRTWTWNHTGSSTDGYYTSITGPTVSTGTLTASYTYSGSNVWTGNSGDGNLLTATDPAGGVTTYHYDSSRRIDKITSPIGNQITFSYASDGYGTSGVNSMTLVTNTSTGAGYTYYFTRSGYSTTGGTATETVQDPNGHNTVYTLDSHDHVKQVTDALGHSRSQSYGTDSNGNSVTSAVNANGTGSSYTSTYGYDTDNRATSTSDPATGGTASAAATSLSYAETAGTITNRVSHWLPSGSTDANGSTNSYTWNTTNGNLTKVSTTVSGGTVDTNYTYNPDAPTAATCGGKPGQVCTAVDGNSHTTSYSYATNGDLSSVTPPSPLGGTSFTYDNVGRVATKTDGKSQITRYTYDGDGRVTQIQYAGTTTCTSTDISNKLCIQLTYNADGTPATMVDDTGTTSYAYDSLGRETSRTLPSTTAMSLTYDGVGNVLTYTDGSGTITYGYNNANQLTSVAEPGGSCTTVPTSKCTTFTNDNNGLRLSTTYPTSPNTTVMTVSRDNSGRVTRVRTLNGTTVIADYSYTYNRNLCTSGPNQEGQLRMSMIDNKTSLTTTYCYDTLDRLTSAVEKNGGGTTTASWSYGYDNAGNRTSATIAGTSNTFGYNNANELTSRNGSSTGWSYDGNGNETAAVGAATRSSESWNSHDQLTSSTVSGTAITFSYTGLGQDTRLTAGNHSIRNGTIGITKDATSSSTVELTRDPGGTLVANKQGSASYYYVFDGLGSVVAVVDATGAVKNTYSYDPYGVSRSKSETVVNPFQYTGGYLDSQTGLYKLGARYLDPTLGRFTSQDPSGREANAYAYARNAPCSHTDPTGLLTSNQIEVLKACAGGAVFESLVAFFTAPEAIPDAILEGCLSGGVDEALALALDDTGHTTAADIVRLGGGLKDVGSFFGIFG